MEPTCMRYVGEPVDLGAGGVASCRAPTGETSLTNPKHKGDGVKIRSCGIRDAIDKPSRSPLSIPAHTLTWALIHDGLLGYQHRAALYK